MQQVTDQAPLENGVVYVVPANRLVEISNHAIAVRVNGSTRVKPSVDLLLSSAAAAFVWTLT